MRKPMHGSRISGHSSTRFSLWAPDARSVAVEFSNGDTHLLEAVAAGWHQGEIACGAGTEYRFVIDGQLQVPDPASHAQPEGIDGFSKTVDHSVWRWTDKNWKGRPWHESVICELHVGLLNGFEGVISHLLRFKQLGITALQLMPVAEFAGTRNWGYDGVLPFAPHHSYGSPDDLKALVDAAHAMNIMIFIDVVYNHFGPDGNYLHDYASQFFRHDISTPWGAAIDFRRQEVREFFIENALMWIHDYHVDGLRFDAVHAINEQDFLIELADRIRGSIPPDRHVHLVLENEHNNADLLASGFDAQWNDDAHNVLHTILTGEEHGYYADYSTRAAEKLARCLGEGFVYQGEETRQGIARGQPSGHLCPTSFVMFLQNHDQIGNRAFGERLIALTDHNRLIAATALMLLSPMIPMIFMGEETGSRQPFLYFTDHNAELAVAITEGREKEFSKFPEYSNASRPVPPPNTRETFIASDPYQNLQYENAGSSGESIYSALLALRKNRITPWLGNSRFGSSEVTGPYTVCASWHLDASQLLVIDINLGLEATGYRDIPGSETIFEYRINRTSRVMEPGSIHVRLQDLS